MKPKEVKVQQLIACEYEDLPKYTPVINAMNLEYYVWIRLPDYIDENYSFYDLQEIVPSHLNILLETKTDRVHRERNIWIRILFSILGKSIGQHIYKLKFVDKENNVVTLYFSYIIQNDHPKKPYRYMDRKDRCCGNIECGICN